MKNFASIRVRSDATEVLFAWLNFDGDDCFGEFNIEIADGSKTERFEFGPCVVRGLRKVVKFFRGSLDMTDGASRFPDLRTYDLTRNQDGMLLQIRFGDSGSIRNFQMNRPTLSFDDEFLHEYDDSEAD